MLKCLFLWCGSIPGVGDVDLKYVALPQERVLDASVWQIVLVNVRMGKWTVKESTLTSLMHLTRKHFERRANIGKMCDVKINQTKFKSIQNHLRNVLATCFSNCTPLVSLTVFSKWKAHVFGHTRATQSVIASASRANKTLGQKYNVPHRHFVVDGRWQEPQKRKYTIRQWSCSNSFHFEHRAYQSTVQRLMQNQNQTECLNFAAK